MIDRIVELRRVGQLKAHPNNVRTHPNKQIERLAQSLKTFGFTSPVLIDENGFVLAGHARVAAARVAGVPKVPCIVLKGLTEAQKRAYLLADNKLAEHAGYDRAALAVELHELVPLLAEAGLGADLTGFEAGEIDALIADYVDREDDPADDIPALPSDPVTKPGDVWEMRGHRLRCGDARSPADIGLLMGPDRAAMVITDPPYNLPTRDFQGRGKIKHRNFVEGFGEMSRDQFTRFLHSTLSLSAKYSVSGSLAFVFMDWRHAREMLEAGERAAF